MSLTPGSRLGPYEILAPIGAGGMGEVYRARDSKLKRDVALKVLPDAFAADPDRMARFQREAEVLASLNHPHIAHIYGVEDRAIAMELVEGRNLQGPLPFETALLYARQIAEALEYAHERGVIHRDLKPANVKVTADDTVKLLDFGLAKAVEDPALSCDDPSNSPTLTLGATRLGMILGTAAYMSPEQAAGKPVDRRADIWSFGAVLFEMLSGQQPFRGENASDTLATVMKLDPDWTALPNDTPAAIVKLLRRCLTKDRKQRLQAIGEARVALEHPAEEAAAVSAPPRSRFRDAGWIAAAALAAALAALAFLYFREKPPAAELVRLQIVPPEKNGFADTVVLAPDGRKVVFEALGPNGRPMLWIRSLDSLETRPMAGTEGALNDPFWSPDSRFIGFAVAGFPEKLKRVEATGGAPQTLCEIADLWFGGAWNAQGTILFGAGLSGLFRVPEGGGQAAPVTTLDPARGELFHSGPAFLPDGRHFLYERFSNSENGGVYVGSLDDRPEQQIARRLLSSASDPVFVPSPQAGLGHILFLREGTLVAQPLDTRQMELTGAAVSLAEDIGSTATYGWFSASTTGALAYRTGRASAVNSQLLWFDRQGKLSGQIGPPSDYNDVQLSPDRKSVIVDKGIVANGINYHIWVGDVARGVFRRLNPGNASELAAAASPDGSVAFSYGVSSVGGDIYRTLLSGAGMPELLFKSPLIKHPNDISRDGRFLIYDEHHPTRRQDLYILPLSAPGGQERKPIPFLVTAADETFGQFSPDGKWVAYSSDESGRREVYVQGFAPDHVPAVAGGKSLISSAGGDKPRWSHDGKEIYYIALNGKLMAVPVKAGSSFEPGLAIPLFDTHARGFFSYAVATDGRFLINTVPDAGEAAPNSSPVTVVLNWQAGLKK